jgi:hypothetical protein
MRRWRSKRFFVYIAGFARPALRRAKGDYCMKTWKHCTFAVFFAVFSIAFAFIACGSNDSNGTTHTHNWGAWILLPETEEEQVTCQSCGAAGTRRSIFLWYDDNGSSNGNNFEISTAGQLHGLAKIVNGTRDNLNAAFNFEGKTVSLTADIDLSGIDNWTPIGLSEYFPFSGTFNGSGHTVSNMCIRQNGYSGLFGGVSNAAIKNVGIVDASIIINGSNGCISGGLVSVVYNDSHIEDVFVTGVVSSGSQFIGGIVGLFNNDNNSITRSWSTASVTGGDIVAGIVGYAKKDGHVIENNAALNPRITATSPSTNWNGRVGLIRSPAVGVNNLAWEGMSTVGVPFVDHSYGNGLFDDSNCESISTAAINADGTLGGRFTAPVWTTANGRLPSLGGRTMPMPAHLQP